MSTPGQARIGPNAIIQTVQALIEHYGEERATTLLRQGGQAHLLSELPTEMVDEAHFHTLLHALVVQTESQQMQQVLTDAGQRTARYLLAHRIPGFFQTLVRLLPRRPGLALLLKAISFNAWTFVGSGQYSYTLSQQPTIHVVVSYPSVDVVAYFYGGTFEHLVQVLVDRQTTLITKTQGEDGTIDCVYTLMW